MSDIVISSSSTLNIYDKTKISIGIFISSKARITITDISDIKLNHYKQVKKYINPRNLLYTGTVLNIQSSKMLSFNDVKVDNILKSKSFDFVGINKGNNNDSTYKYYNFNIYVNNIFSDTMGAFTKFGYFIREFIRDFNNNFEIPIGVILADKKINFYFSNLSRVTKTIKQIRIPDYTGIELDTDYSGFTIPPYGSIRISGTAKFDKGAEFVKDFLVVELESGELLRFEFVIVRQDDTIFYFAPDRGTHKEEYEIFTHDFTSLNGCQTVKLVVPTPKLTNLENTLSVDNQRDFVKIQSVIDYQHKYEMSAALWVWSFEIDPIGVVKEIPLPFAELKEIFDKSEKILIYEKNSFNKIQIGAVADVDTNKISLKASVNLENNGNNYYIVPIRKGWAADSLSTTVGMFRNGSIDMTFKEN